MKKLVLILLTVFLITNTVAQQSSNVQVDLKKTEPAPLKSSEYADIWLEVTNEGSSDANDVRIEFQETFPFTADPDEKTEWKINELTPGEEYQLHLQARVDDNAVQGNNTLNFLVDHGSISYEEKVSVEVRSDNDILSVARVQFPDNVAPGSTQEMSVTLENMAGAQLKNIEAALDVSEDSLPIATSGASAKNLEKIEPGENAKLNFTLNIDESAENGVYKLPLDLSFENEAGTEFERSLTTGVVVGGEPQLEANINNENTLSPGSTETVTLRVVNRGHGSADFVQMTLQQTENMEVISPETVYLGDMDSDDFQTAEYQVHIDSEAENLTMPVELSYKDNSGDVSETQSIETKLYSSDDLQRLGLSQRQSLVPVAVVGVLIVLGALFYWRRRKKRK